MDSRIKIGKCFLYFFRNIAVSILVLMDSRIKIVDLPHQIWWV